MPRVSKWSPVLFALLITTAGMSAVGILSISSPQRIAHIGHTVPVTMFLPGATGQTVHLFAGTSLGSTVVQINGSPVTIPVGGSVFGSGSAVFVHEGASIDAFIPSDPSLIGSTATWVAVVIDDASGRIVAIARAGGPIIEDAIC